MSTRIVWMITLLLMGVISAYPQPADGTGEDELVPPVLEDPVFLIVPQELWHLSENWGEGLFRLRIGVDGSVEDWIPLSLPHYKLFKPFESVFASYQCEPALLNGEPITVDVEISIPLAGVGGYGVISLNVGTYVESRMSSLNPNINRLQVVHARKLDSPLSIESSGEPLVLVDENGVVQEGIIEMEFYVDPNGIPRMIQPVGDPDPVMASVAKMNVEQIRFNPPRAKGRPAVTRVRMPVVLGES